jgi:hypothetical protein
VAWHGVCEALYVYVFVYVYVHVHVYASLILTPSCHSLIIVGVQIFKGSLFQTAVNSSLQAQHVERYFTRAELREVFSLKDPSFSQTQRHLAITHPSSMRQSDAELDAHIESLQQDKERVFGISDHDLLFTRAPVTLVHDTGDDEMKFIAVRASTKLIQSRKTPMPAEKKSKSKITATPQDTQYPSHATSQHTHTASPATPPAIQLPAVPVFDLSESPAAEKNQVEEEEALFADEDEDEGREPMLLLPVQPAAPPPVCESDQGGENMFDLDISEFFSLDADVDAGSDAPAHLLRVSMSAGGEGEASEGEDRRDLVADSGPELVTHTVLAAREPNTVQGEPPTRTIKTEGEKGEEGECGQRVAMLVQYYDGLEGGSNHALRGESGEMQHAALCAVHPSALAINGGTVLSHRCQCKLSEAEVKRYNTLADKLASVDVLGELADAHMLDIGLEMVDLCDQDARLQERVIVLAHQQGML